MSGSMNAGSGGIDMDPTMPRRFHRQPIQQGRKRIHRHLAVQPVGARAQQVAGQVPPDRMVMIDTSPNRGPAPRWLRAWPDDRDVASSVLLSVSGALVGRSLVMRSAPRRDDAAGAHPTAERARRSLATATWSRAWPKKTNGAKKSPRRSSRSPAPTIRSSVTGGTQGDQPDLIGHPSSRPTPGETSSIG